MKNLYEVILNEDALTSEIISKLLESIHQISGFNTKLDLILKLDNSIVRLFVASDSNLSPLANSIQGALLTPAKDGIVIPESKTQKRFFKFVAGKNILDFAERQETKEGLTLDIAVFKVRIISMSRIVTDIDIHMKNVAGKSVLFKQKTFRFPYHLLEIPFGSENLRYIKKEMPRYLDIEKSMRLLSSDESGAIFRVDGFPYFNRDYFVGIHNFEFDAHGVILGASGSGKSKLITLLIERINGMMNRDNYRIVLVDPHASLEADLAHIEDRRVIDFKSQSTELFQESADDISASTELTASLFKSLLAENYNSRLERVLKYSLTVLFTAQAMSTDMFKKFLTEAELRNKMLSHVEGYVSPNVVQFFGTDFNEIKNQHYNESISPLVSLIDELQLQTGLTDTNGLSVESAISDKFLSVFSLNKASMGDKAVKTIAGLIIQQVFLLAQSRKLNKKIIMIIDEVSVVQTPVLAQILSEARKFGLFVILTQQYFGQIEKPIQEAIFANTKNYFVFKVSEEDARAIEGNLSINLPDDRSEKDKALGISLQDAKVKILTELNPRECLLRLSAGGVLNPCIKAVTVDTKEQPIASRTQLQEYTKQELPSKFTEVMIESGVPTRLSPVDLPTVTESVPRNLSELLASTSSSRYLVNKDKIGETNGPE